MSAIERFRPGDAPDGGSPGSSTRVPPVSPQMALRVAILGGIAVVMFGVIFFRLWYLQVLTGEQYVQEAAANSVRELPIPAPRGQILDRQGQPIVESTVTNAVQIVPSALPPAGHPRLVLYRRLGRLLGMSAAHIEALVIKGRTSVPYAPVTIKTDAGRGVLTVLAEQQRRYPGVTQQPVSIRAYPYGEMAANVLGYVGQVSKTELAKPAFRGVQQGTVVGQEGLEYRYDRYLRGRDGEQRVQVNSEGYPVPTRLRSTPPTAGYSLKTTLDLGLQREGERALFQGIENARAGGKPAPAGGFVAMDPLNGEVLAIGSYPSFDPNKFTKPLTEREYHELEGVTGAGGSEEVPSRLVDRATNGAYPTGSAFKPITAMAALEAGVINPSEGLGAGQCIDVGGEQFCNAGHADYGAVGLVEALKVSSEHLLLHGRRAGQQPRQRDPEQGPRSRDRQADGDRPAERDDRHRSQPGMAGAAEQGRSQVSARAPRPPVPHRGRTGRAVAHGRLQHGPGGRPGLPADNPLQMAVAYSTLANAYLHGGYGEVVRPHLGLQIDESSTGGLVQSLPSPPARPVHLNDEDLSLVMQGIHEAASQPGGTSADVWTGWNQEQHPVYGKTGTAERPPHLEQSWHMCFINDPTRPIVIAGDRGRRRVRRRNRRADRPADRSEVVRPAREVRCRDIEDVLIDLCPPL